MLLRDIQTKLGGEVIGEVSCPLTGIGTIERAQVEHLTFFVNPRYRRALAETGAGAVIVGPSHREATTLPRIVAGNPYAYFARAAQLFSPPLQHLAGMHSSAVVHEGAVIAASASVAEFVSIGKRTVIGERVRIGVGCVIGDDVVIGDDTQLTARVTVYPGCRIGDRNLLHAGVVIGADGFGFASDQGRWIKIPQTGHVVIGDDCEIGANTTIDCGAIDDTRIGSGVKIDNQVQIAHNVIIGDHTVIAGCVGISGSSRIGSRVMIGGGVGIVGHIEICDDTVVSGMTLVAKSITVPGTYTSGMPMMLHREWLKNAAHLRHLDELANALRKKRETSS